MKKILNILCIAALLLGGCSDSDEEEYATTGDFISFLPMKVNKLASRAINQNMVDQTLNSGNMHVMAQVQGENKWYIDDDLCKIDQWDWTTNPLCPSFQTVLGVGRKRSNYTYNSVPNLNVYYWPSNKDIAFYGYYTQKDEDLAYIDRTAGSSQITYTLADHPNNQCDLLVAEPDTTNAVTAATTGVLQKFAHTMAMLRFDFISKIKSDGAVVLREISYETPSEGIVNITDPMSMTQNLASPKITVLYNPNLPVRNVNDYYTSEKKYSELTASLVFPTTASVFSIKVKASRADGTGEISRIIDLVVPEPLDPLDPTTRGYKAGCIYQYVITYSADVIDFFDASVVQWEDVEGVVEDLTQDKYK